MRVDYVFCPLCMVWPGNAASWNRQDCNNECKHLVSCDWSVFKCSDTNVIFQTAIS